MRIHLLAVGTRMDSWISQGYQEYAKRLPAECCLQLTEIPAGKRGKNADIPRILQQEGERMLAAIPADTHVIAMDLGGRSWSTEQLSQQMTGWLASGRDTVLLVGGPEGLADACRQRAQQAWSLSALTLPHPLVRIVVAEQLYRAWSILKGHPYHR